MSANHLRRLESAKAIVKAAAKAGANAVKLQTFNPEQMVGNSEYEIPSGPWKGKKLIDLYKETVTPREWHAPLFELIRKHKMKTVASPFHPDDVDFLESLDCEIYKVASFEIGYLSLIRRIALTGKPIILSTGMATYDEVERSVQAIRAVNPDADIALLKCTSAYPASIEDANLGTMLFMESAFMCKIGISDHTLTDEIALAATALGADIIEKHLTLSRNLGGQDAAFSIEPIEFKEMVSNCSRIAKTIGTIVFAPLSSEMSSQVLKRSLWVAEDIKAGTTLEPHHIKVARPYGLMPASEYDNLLGSEVKRDMRAGEPFSYQVIG